MSFVNTILFCRDTVQAQDAKEHSFLYFVVGLLEMAAL